jgi:hypothetical protein
LPPAVRQLAARLASPAALLRGLWLLAGLAVLLGWNRDTLLGLLPAARELPRLDGAVGRPWIAGDFAPQIIAGSALPRRIQHVSTWVGSDAAVGRAETAWFKANRRTVYVAVAGYPTRPGRTLVAEFRDTAGTTIARVDFRASGHPDPREAWALWEIRRPPAAVAVRFVASDQAVGWGGWFAFSHPFRAPPPELTSAFQLLLVAATVALALVLLWGPGLLVCPAAASAPARLLWFLGLGPLLLAFGGAVVWAAGPLVSPRLSSTVLVALLWLAVGLLARRRAFTLPVSPVFARVLAVAALVVAAAAAKAAVSRGTPGELFRGTVSRNFALSDRIDSRFNFYAVQAAAHGWAPASPRVEKFYYPWTFFSRGPLAGLAAIPVVLATGGQPPDVLPEQGWVPFDPTGFAAYRLTLVPLAGSIVVAFFLLLLPFVDERWAALGAGLLALTPFGFHEILFTWPKWIATAWLIASFSLVHVRRPLAAGLALGVGFLFHPLVLLWSPLLAAWSLGRSWPEGWVAALRRTAVLAAASAVLVLPWMALGALMPHLPDTPFAGQSNFTRYWFLADSQHAAWATWLHTRWLNFANTFIPLHLFADSHSFHHFRFSSAYEPSGPLEKTLFLPWNSLPFGLGLALWLVSAVALWRAGRIRRAATLLFVAAPVVLLVAYWGGEPLGLLRECGHPLFAAVLALTVLAAAAVPGRLAAFLAHPAAPWLPLPELLALLWLPALAHAAPSVPAAHAHFDPLVLLLNVLALAAAAWVLSGLRPRSSI